jgi:predicted transcriptional regulator
MSGSGKVSRFISLHPDDASLLDEIAYQQRRTRSEVVMEALRGYYAVLAKAAKDRANVTQYAVGDRVGTSR